MRSTAWKYIIGLTLLTVTAIPLRLAAQQSQQQRHYVVKDLGTLGGSQGVAEGIEGISDRGWVVGSANLPGDQSGQAFLWRDGVMTPLGTLGGLNSQEQWAVHDNRGLIVGDAETAIPDPNREDFCGFDRNSGVPATGLICLGFLWQDGAMTALPTLGGNNARATAVNNHGQVVGIAEKSTQLTGCSSPQVFDVEAVIWGAGAGHIQPLPPLPGDASVAVGLLVACGGSPLDSRVSGFSPRASTSSRAALMSQNGARYLAKPRLRSQGAEYTLEILPNEGGLSNANYVDNQGHVGGLVNPPGDATEHGAFWVNGQLTDIGTLGGPDSSLLTGNLRGSFFAGISETAAEDPNQENFCSFFGGGPYTHQCLGMVFRPKTNTLIALPPLPGGINSAVQGANGNRIAGYAENGFRDPACAPPQVNRYEAVLWSMDDGDGAVALEARLQPLAGDTVAIAGQVNPQGVAVGTSGTCGQIFSPQSTAHAVLWEPGQVQAHDLGSLGGTFNNFAFSINRGRQVTGVSNLAGDAFVHAFLWQDEKMADLGTLRADDFASFGNTISDRGAVVGGSCGPNDCHGFIWKNGVMSDLNDLLSAPTTLTITSGNFINARGDISVAAFDPTFGDQVAGVLHPVVPDPNDGD